MRKVVTQGRHIRPGCSTSLDSPCCDRIVNFPRVVLSSRSTQKIRSFIQASVTSKANESQQPFCFCSRTFSWQNGFHNGTNEGDVPTQQSACRSGTLGTPDENSTALHFSDPLYASEPPPRRESTNEVHMLALLEHVIEMIVRAQSSGSWRRVRTSTAASVTRRVSCYMASGYHNGCSMCIHRISTIL